jgi:hypothetical protein
MPVKDRAAVVAHKLVWNIVGCMQQPNGVDLPRLVDETATDLREEFHNIARMTRDETSLQDE